MGWLKKTTILYKFSHDSWKQNTVAKLQSLMNQNFVNYNIGHLLLNWVWQVLMFLFLIYFCRQMWYNKVGRQREVGWVLPMDKERGGLTLLSLINILCSELNDNNLNICKYRVNKAIIPYCVVVRWLRGHANFDLYNFIKRFANLVK